MALTRNSRHSFTWARRTRIGGEWEDGAGTVPLAEAADAYEVDILSGPGGAVNVVVYQLSAVIGRGFPRAVTLEIS